ncbi:MAG: DUF1615 family protein [Desulfomonilaceae bacterium]|nr:DUF1615 family protein [Desulfomonilaceae bacterium]
MIVIPDPQSIEKSSGKPEDTEAAVHKGWNHGVEDASSANLQRSEGDREAGPLVKRRDELLSTYDAACREETDLMLRGVRVIDRDEAVRWLQRFISSPPFNCPVNTRAAWIDAVISAVERNSLPICKEILALLVSLVSIESGFNENPPAIDRSRGEDMTSVLERAEKELFDKMGKVMSVPPVPQVYRAYREKYYPRIAACETERDVEDVARSIVEDLKSDAQSFPDFLKKIIFKELDKVKNVVRTKGSMQLNFPLACYVMEQRGETYTREELTEYMYTIPGGVDVGTAALKPMFVQYAARYASPGDLSWLFLVGMDYHYGPFSSRNMMEQIRFRDLSGVKIPIDGDFLHYDENGEPLDKDSQTLQAVTAIFPSAPREAILDAFLLEKFPHYIYTDFHKAVSKAHLDRFGETPFAVIGDLWMGEDAQIKHGVMWKTRSYLRKLDRLLNSVPWDG